MGGDPSNRNPMPSDTDPTPVDCAEPRATALPSPPAFARGAAAGPSAPRGRRRHHHFSSSERNDIDLRDLDETPPLVPPPPCVASSTAPGTAPTSSGCEPATRILDFLFLGGVRDATNAEFLGRENIQTILNVSREEYWSVDRRIVVHPFVVDDTTDADIKEFFRPTFHLIESARRAYYEALRRGASNPPRVLVHCQRGRSRSATVVLAYLIRRNGWTVAEALQYVTHRRPCVEPNIGFIDALREYQESMDTEERSRLCSALCLAVRNIASSTASSEVHKFFEDKVGCVKEVRALVHAPRPTSAQTIVSSSSREDCVDHNNSGGGRSGARNDCSEAEGLGRSRATGIGGNGEVHTLSLIFFAEAECVPAAQRLYAKRPEIFDELGVLPGKELKLTIPRKLIRVSKGT